MILFAFPVLAIKATNVVFILYSLLVLYEFLKERNRIQWKSFAAYALLSLVFLPYLIELILYPNDAVIQFETEKKILFFVAPFIFYLDSYSNRKNDLGQAIIVFIVTMAFISLVSLFYLFVRWDHISLGEPADQAFQLRLAFENFSGLHPSYYGLFSSTAGLWIIAIYRNYSKALRITFLILLLPLILLNCLIASKMALLILGLGLLWFSYTLAKSKGSKLLFVLLILSGMILMFFFIPSLNSRLTEFYTFFTHKRPENTLVERSVIFNCNRSIFLSDFLTGIGSRNTQALLDYCYTWVGFNKGALIHLNSHNQFFTFGINYGIGMLFLFISTGIFLFIKSRKSLLAGIFWMSAFLIMMTESLLERQMGIYYFLFFALLFQSVKRKDNLADLIPPHNTANK